MRFKKISFLLIISLILSLFLASTVMGEEEIIDPEIPDSWYKPPKTASEMGIKEFNQAPMLEEEVKEGELPPVKERLPEDPIVQEPYDEIGKYGGTVATWDIAVDGAELNYWNNWAGGTGSLQPPDYSGMIPYFLKDWEFSNDYKDMTVYLRKGMKWSDGEELTAEDYMYWWEHVANNEDLNPTPPEKWSPPLLDLSKEDKYSVTFHYGTQVPTRPRTFLGMIAIDLAPAHFMKQFHPDFVGKEKVEEMAEEVGLESWYDFYQRIQGDSPTHPEYEYQRPVLNTYITVERTETTLVAERNPYFPVVDTEGNQLPYINKIKVNLANSSQMAATKAATGEATFSGRHLDSSDIPLYKKNEEKENYNTLLYTRPNGAEVMIQLMYTTEEKRLREIFWEDNFRKALSLGIDREEINQKIYYGEAIPRQMTIIPTSDLFEEGFAEAYANYDPERAREYLDEIGMVDVDGDGFREGPDGEKFNPQLTYCKMGPVDPTRILEMLKTQWQEIGLDIELKKISRDLWFERRGAGKLEMTVWTGTMPNPFYVTHWLAPGAQTADQSFIGWNTWFVNPDAEIAMEPPAIMKELNELAKTALYSTNVKERKQAAKEILEIQSEKIWYIGTVGMGPQPIIVSNDLQNIPKRGYWVAIHGANYLIQYRPWQMYLD